ncbi:MAG: carbohydrate binding family 9 domain-containing protein [bacterium]|nr:carbohydrate binding family 9 domain-containing protein [bacterium]
MTDTFSARLRLFCLLLILTTATAAQALEGFDPDGTGPRYPANADGRHGPVPNLPVYRITNGGIEIDGYLDEQSWIDAPTARGFTQFEPDRHGTPGEQTVFKVAYDDDAIYFAVACLRTNGTAITSCLSRRDQITSSDRIRIYISPYGDMITGYHFRINPDGVKEDYYNYGDLYHDRSWDAVWDAKTSRDENGWYAEFRIPFSSVRYRAQDSMTWGFNVFQYIHALDQRTAWSNWDRDQSGFMSRSGTISGLDGISAPRQLEITPYVMGSVTDPADPTASGPGDEEWDTFGNFGADLKYGVTADLTLNATFQPDFGQVEADPSVLNLSPFETYYEEKRPFFVEGAQFFWHPDFTVFYSRRIGTGSENARIRTAGKLTGKLAGDVSTAVLFALTDRTGNGQAHNFLKGGDERAVYAIGRFGKDFADGNHSVHVMQTAVMRDEDTFAHATRDGYVTGGDFELNFKDRMYQVTGSVVGSIVDPSPDPLDPSMEGETLYGTGSRFELEKRSGDWRWALTTRHQGDRLDLNDMGYLRNPNHYAAQAWVTRVFNGDDENSFLTGGNVHARYYKNWTYAGRDFADPSAPGSTLWSYDRWEDLLQTLSINGWGELRSRWGFYWGTDISLDGTDLYATRRVPGTRERGPLMAIPDNHDSWFGIWSDQRKSLGADLSFHWSADEEGSNRQMIELQLDWVASSRLTNELDFSYTWGYEDAQWLRNENNPGGGIGDVSYAFAGLDQRTWDMTLRSSYLFSRDQSLDLYLQPFLTVGDYDRLRELAAPGSYDLRDYAGFDVRDEDFSFAAVNLNLVYRWEYRPGSTVYLVWAHSHADYDQRGFHGPDHDFENGFDSGAFFGTEARNTVMAKVSYWFSI